MILLSVTFENAEKIDRIRAVGRVTELEEKTSGLDSKLELLTQGGLPMVQSTSQMLTLICLLMMSYLSV